MREYKEIKVAVAGTGYVGLSIATLLAQHHHVTAVDVIPEKVDKPQIRNLIGCSGTMPEKLQGSFSSTRSLYKRNVRRHKPPLPHKAA